MKLNTWNENKMAQAVDMFHTMHQPTWTVEKKSIHQCVEIWGVPYSTLCLRIKVIVSGTKYASGGIGKPHIFNRGPEEELESVLKETAAIGFLLDASETRNIAYDYAEEHGIKGFNRKSGHTGKHWLKYFMKRHKDLHHKQEDLLSIYRAQSMTPEVVTPYFDVLLKTYNVLGMSQSFRVWNVDETGVMSIPKPKKVIGEVGKPARSLVPSERGELSTIITLVNVYGDFMPPFVIHKGQRVQKNWLKGKPDSWVVCASTNAYINKKSSSRSERDSSGSCTPKGT